ncbi:MAG: NYN domain-containing protein, partial [Phototrophicales bacterium]
MRLNNFTKNLADMQIVVDTMETLVDNQEFGIYVLLTGDRDFTPLVQTLRKRGKYVIGAGLKHTASRSFVNLCDEYI